jgi:tetratricopeptide (TPR) repeat protein
MVNHEIKNINSLIQNPSKVSDKELAYFFDLTLKYPSSSFCFLFLTKILHQQERIGFEQSLNSTALRIPDRTLLYDMIHSENSSKHEEKINPVNNLDDDINELEKNIYGDLIQNQIINELELLDSKDDVATPKIISEKETMSFEEWLSGSSTLNHNQSDIDSIIKNLNERKILKKKESFYSGSKAAKESLKENNKMNTETLAEIYVKQGNYPKAITIYEQLMLSNPEKKVFFASRINYIKQKTQP